MFPASFAATLVRRGTWRHSGILQVLRRGLSAPGERVTADDEIWATEIKLNSKEKALEVEFNTGERFRYPAELLRVESPAAEAKKDRQGRPKITHGRRHVGIIGLEPVGSYALRLDFDDMHSTGIYTWPFLHDLGRHKLSRARDYIRLLRRHGLSRDPQRPPALGSKRRGSQGGEQGAA